MVDPRIIGGRLGNQMFQLAYLYAQVRKGVIPDIFVQHPKYFDEFRDEIKKLFGEGIGYVPYVSVHFRAGRNPLNPNEPSYLENPFYYPIAKTGYYAKAIELFPNDKFLVFSDNMDLAREYFIGDRFSFDKSDNDIDSFNLMASCDGHIMANSSFSWWASYLSPAHGKTVYPKKWFNDNIERVGFLDEWIGIDV